MTAGRRGWSNTVGIAGRLLLTLGVALCVTVRVSASTPTTYAIDLPRQSVAAALNGLSEQTGVPVVFSYDLAKNRISNPVLGRFTLLQALDALLKGTGLSGGLSEKGMLTITSASIEGQRGEASVKSNGNKSADGVQAIRRGGIGALFATLVAAFSASAQETTPQSGMATPDRSAPLAEIVVTAEKRTERIQDVPVPVTAISAETLVDNNQARLEDYYTQVPSLILSQGVQSSQSVTIRGLPTSTFLLDGVPINGVMPDIDPGSLSRVEVLRGPQGTLYGANNLGGLINIITVDPSTERISGRVEAGVDSVYNGYDLGYDTRGSINFPLSETLALRASAFQRQDAGYIDNPFLHIDGINRDHADGGQLAGLWKPTEDFSLKLSALYQEIKGGNNDVDLYDGLTLRPLGDLQQSYPPGTGPYDRRTAAYSAVVKAKVGVLELTSLTGYSENLARTYYDGSPTLAPYTMLYFPGVGGATVFSTEKATNISQETRLAASLWQKVDVLVGGYYSRSAGPFTADILATSLTDGAIAGSFGHLSFGTTTAEYAAFTDITFHFTDKFDIQVGGRESRVNQDSPDYISGDYATLFYGSSPYIAPTLHSRSDSFTYLVTPRFKFSQDLMVYARLASGFIPGGANPGTMAPEYGPEKTKNYEIGAKGDFFDHMVSVDASLYYIDFVGLQNLFFDKTTGVSYVANAGTAKSQGLELSVEFRPTSSLKVAGWVVFSDAELTEIPEGVVMAGTPAYAGDPLPDSSRFSSNLSVDQEFPIGAVKGFVGATVSYIGDREGPYAVQRLNYPAYARTDLRAGMKRDSWTANFYVNNIADRRGVISAENTGFIPQSRYLIQPRTVGVNIVKAF
jgi:iron complex outermembrane recepter protein